MKRTLFVSLLALALGTLAAAAPAEASPRTNLCAYLKAGELIGVVNWLGLLDCGTVTASTRRVPPPDSEKIESRHPPCLACDGFPRVEPDRARDDDGQPVEPRGERRFETRPKVRRGGS